LSADPVAGPFQLRRALETMGGLPQAVERYPAVAAAALAEASARARLNALQVLRAAATPLAPFLDAVVALAFDPAKTVREAAEAWLASGKELSVPALRQIVEQAEPRRGEAAQEMLARLESASATEAALPPLPDFPP